MRVGTRPRCGECGRVFVLADPEQAAEWVAGHDCEAGPEEVPDEPDPRTCPHFLERDYSPWAGWITRCSRCGVRVIDWEEDDE